MTRADAIQKWQELNKQAAAVSGSGGWSSIRMDDFEAENALKSGAEFMFRAIGAERIEAALVAFEQEITAYANRGW